MSAEDSEVGRLIEAMIVVPFDLLAADGFDREDLELFLRNQIRLRRLIDQLLEN